MSEEQWTGFFKSPIGIGVTVIFISFILILIAGYFYRKKQFSARVLTVSAVCIALSAILSMVTIYTMPQGGSVTPCSMLFIVLTGYWFGPETGIMAGIASGLLNLAIRPQVVHPIQLLLDYPLAFGALGVSGFFRHLPYNGVKRKQLIKPDGLFVGYIARVLYCKRPQTSINGPRKYSERTCAKQISMAVYSIARRFKNFISDGLCIGYIAGVLVRWFMSFISGFVFFSQYAGDMNPVLYSAVYNITYILPEMIITLIILSIPAIRNAIDIVGRDMRPVK